MAEITQKLGFDAKQAINTLDTLTDKLNAANMAMANMKGASAGARALSNTEKQVKSTRKSTSDFTVSWQTMVRVLQTQIIVRSLNFVIDTLKDGVEAAREFGLAIEEVRTIDSAARGAEELSEQILAISDAVGKVPTDIAEGVYQTLSNQVVEAGEALEFTAEAAKLATITASETGDAVNALSSVMNSYSLEAEDANRISDTLFATVEQGRLRLSEIANVIGRVTPLTSQLGITWEETAAAIATMTRSGVRADTAITQLRAVTTRLIKPTEDVLALYRRWGVTDGREAIKTFGGLEGVLRKISEETGGSSQEMAELLRNVRAITGAFGIMVDDGRTLDEAMNAITGSTGRATNAWNEFAQSDAQRLTQATQKLENQITRLGKNSLPIVNLYLDAANNILENFGRGWDRVTGQLDLSAKSANTFASVMARAESRAKGVADALAASRADTLENLANASNKYYAAANRKEQELARIREQKIEEATAAYLDAAEQIGDFYKDQLKAIESFADRARDKIKRNFDQIAGIRRDVADQELEYRLDNEDNAYRRQRILEDEFQQQLRARRDLLSQLGADEASQKAALDANERLVDLAKQRLAAAEDAGASTREIQRLQDEVVDAIQDEEAIRRSIIQLTEGSVGAAESQSKILQDIVAREEEIYKLRKSISEDGYISATEQAQLNEAEAALDRLNKKAEQGAEVLKGFGLDTAFAETAERLSAALDQAHKDWQAEVKLAEAEFAKALIPIKVKLELGEGGVRKQLADALGIQQLPNERLDDYAARIDEAAVAVREQVGGAWDKIAATQGQINDGLKVINETLRRGAALRQEQLQAAYNEQVKENAFTVVRSEAEREALQQQMVANAKEEVSAATELDNKIRSATELASRRGQLQEGTIAGLEVEIQRLQKAGDLTKEQARAYKTVANELRDVAAIIRENNDLRLQLPDEDALIVLGELEQLQNSIAEKKLTEAQATQEIEDSLQRGREYMQILEQGSQRTAEGTGNAASNMGQVNVNAQSSASSIGVAAANAAALAANLERAAAAQAAVAATGGGGSGPQTIQNPFQAAGGLVRGQDRQAASLADGESVISARNTRRFFSELNAMNQGSTPVFREQGGSVTNVGDVNVTVQGGDTSQQTVREIATQLRREIKRGNIRLR